MKRNLCCLILFIIFVLSPKVLWAGKNITVEIDGQIKNFSQPPVVLNGRVMVPLRAISETLGAEVYWNDKYNSITLIKDMISVVMHVGSDISTINGEQQEIDTAPQILNGTTMVPLRFISTALGAKVLWDDAAHRVIISSHLETTNNKINSEKEQNKEVVLSFEEMRNWKKSSQTGTMEEDNSTKPGEKLLKLATKKGECWADTTKTANLANFNIVLDFYVHDVTKLSEIHLLMDTSSDWSSYVGYNIVAGNLYNGWNHIFLIPKVFYRLGKNPPSDSQLVNIKRWRIKVVGIPGEECVVSFDRLYAITKSSSKGKVTITFDDGFETVYSEAKGMMDEYRFPGVAYVITDLVGTENRMTIGQLKVLQELGWDIASHSKSHQDLTSQQLTQQEIKEELLGSKKWLVENGFFKGSQHFASPYGKFNESVLTDIKKYYKSHRTILEGRQTDPPVDPYVLKIRNVINTTDITTIKKWIDAAAANKEWLILLFHSFSEPTSTEITVSPIVFNQIIEYLAVAKINVVTISDVIK